MPLTPQGLYALAGRYDVGVTTAAWAVVRSRPDISIVWLRHSPHPRTGDREAMRVQSAASTRFFARGESLKSPLAELAPGESARCEQELQIAGRSELVSAEAWRLRYGRMLLVLQHGDARDRASAARTAWARPAVTGPVQLNLWD